MHTKAGHELVANELRPRRSAVLNALAILLTASIFAIDVFTPFDGAIAVLYIGVILLLAPFGRRVVIASGLMTALLTILAFAFGHLSDPSEGAVSRFLVSLVAILITTLLSIRDRSSRTTLEEQARILELSHDTVIIRNSRDIIVYWNDGAEKLYGWSRDAAIGCTCGELLQCRFPAQEIAAALENEGQWSGEVVRTRRDGTRLVLASRWLRRRDPDGRFIGTIESSADLTERRRADEQLRASERKYRTIFDAAGFATWESDWSETMRIALDSVPDGQQLGPWLESHPEITHQAIAAAVIRDANPAAVDLFEADAREALIGLNLCGRYTPEGASALSNVIVALAAGHSLVEAEVRLQTFGKRIAEVVLRVTLLPGGQNWSHVLVMAFDVTERNEARARYEQISTELAHAGRVSMLGQLAASIAHEVNQPLAAIVNYGKSAKRFLHHSQPDLDDVGRCVDKMISNAVRAADVVDRVRKLARKATSQTDLIDLSELIEDAIDLIRREARAHGVTLRRRSPGDLPDVVADRVQVQQVLVNLLMNGIHSMREVYDRSRELCVDTSVMPDRTIRVAVIDCGTGFPTGAEAQIFEPFFTTKSDGMGIGLSICRSIIENQGGRISAANNELFGATVSFTLPVGVLRAVEMPEPIS
ncbi:PAS domain-containing protein (plasmid) [Rhizobium bangladeshense]|nr:PAS domain-containing protein [Rhizobium bangladeshense]MBX4934729.1 PAS domain-containing protein [Rhizobium bangladeshense]MBY3582763.1 PAS domain-containing protein [Rhizobium bangladeshense]QSY91107.1 PAS domain-containing protein [Rhizobium bangladeshense]QSY96801.1 PAS domain-containing protein [Rhizobium bangladeshense]